MVISRMICKINIIILLSLEIIFKMNVIKAFHNQNHISMHIILWMQFNEMKRERHWLKNNYSISQHNQALKTNHYKDLYLVQIQQRTTWERFYNWIKTAKSQLKLH